MTPFPRPRVTCDTECLPNYWLCMFESGEIFEMFDGHPLDIAGLATTLRRYTIVTFNGNNYDVPLITLALQGATPADLKLASDQIIIGGMKGWQIARPFDWIDHIDLFEVAPGTGSLKIYGGKMHSRKLQDLPIDPSMPLAPAMFAPVRDYCRNDLATTRDLLNAMDAQVALRVEMSAEYGLDLRSKSDAQMAEAVMKKLLPFKPEPPYIAPGTQFLYRPPQWLRFIRLPLIELLARSPFTVNASGGVDASEELMRTVVRIGASTYTMGTGGLHSTETCITFRTDERNILTLPDVASYYPSLILVTEIYPKQIGPQFAAIYRDWYDRRMAAKHAGDKKTANSLKIVLNGTFGKLCNIYSIFYAPSEFIQVTLTGQLALLMLIEMMESCGIPCVSANTDGIVLNCPRGLESIRDNVLHWWETTTGFVTESEEYRLLACRDVNAYIGIDSKGKAKLKGPYAPPEPGPSGWPNPTGQIATDAVVAFLTHGRAIEDTVLACTDIRQFAHIRQVKGGGSFCPNGTLPARTTQIFMRSIVGNLPKPELLAAYDRALAANAAERQYLGKAVRWYYARGSKGCIVTPAGGLVARTEGCRPMMELPDALPDDIDFEWYIREARGMLAEVGMTA